MKLLLQTRARTAAYVRTFAIAVRYGSGGLVISCADDARANAKQRDDGRNASVSCASRAADEVGDGLTSLLLQVAWNRSRGYESMAILGAALNYAATDGGDSPGSTFRFPADPPYRYELARSTCGLRCWVKVTARAPSFRLVPLSAHRPGSDSPRSDCPGACGRSA